MFVVTLLLSCAAAIPWDVVEHAAEDIVDGKATEAELVAVVPAILDHVVDAAVEASPLGPTPLGQLIIAKDGPALQALAELIVKLAVHKVHVRRAGTAAPVGGVFHALFAAHHAAVANPPPPVTPGATL